MRTLRRTAVLAVLLAFAGIAAVNGLDPVEEPAVVVRQEPEQVVAYTIHRGPYDQVGQPIMKLIQSGMFPQGAITFVYLNSPATTDEAHLLTEVRIPVGKDALAKAGTLGDFTDVKTVRALEYAVIKKEIGPADPAALRKALYAWVRENGYEALDACCERFLSQGATDYAQMETEIMVPVAKLEG